MSDTPGMDEDERELTIDVDAWRLAMLLAGAGRSTPHPWAIDELGVRLEHERPIAMA